MDARKGNSKEVGLKDGKTLKQEWDKVDESCSETFCEYACS